MISTWRVDIKDTLPADTTDAFCSSDAGLGSQSCHVYKQLFEAAELRLIFVDFICACVPAQSLAV
jgi:hypothetical protein